MERTDSENMALIDELFKKAECVTYKDKNFVSYACEALGISTLMYFALVSKMQKEGYRYA